MPCISILYSGSWNRSTEKSTVMMCVWTWTFLIDNKSTVCHLDMGLCCIILYQNTDCKYLASIFTVLKNSPILQTKCFVFPSLMIMTLNANFIRSTWSKYWILSSRECGICSTKTFAAGKFEDVLKCITSTD